MFPEDKRSDFGKRGRIENVFRCVLGVSMICLLFCMVFIPYLVFKNGQLEDRLEEMQKTLDGLKLDMSTLQTDVNERSRKDDTREHHLSKRDVTCDLSWLAEHSSILRGPPGPQGPPGNNGIPGIPGTPGIGCPNSSNDNDIDDRPASDDGTSTNVNGTAGSVYVRWGRSTCEDTAELVYEGVIGGAYFSHIGSGSNYQCLPLNPIYDDVVSGTDKWRALMYGTEYQVNSFSPLSAVFNHDAVCAVCRVRSRGTVLMVPARNECPSTEWTREYYGYLMSSYYDHASNKDFICVDRNPEGRDGSSANADGASLYPVEGRCGSLPCGPYVNGNELTCAVCTI